MENDKAKKNSAPKPPPQKKRAGMDRRWIKSPAGGPPDRRNGKDRRKKQPDDTFGRDFLKSPDCTKDFKKEDENP